MNHVVLFDGVCNLCNASVQQLINWDKRDVLKFSSLQSDFSQEILRKNNFDTTQFKSILYIKNQQIFTESDAVIQILEDICIKTFWIKGFKIIPKSIRDRVYRFIANNRYIIFGKQESCWLPTPELQKKFIT